MFIPPYFPEPIVVQDNVADQPYDSRLRFIQQVVALHAVCGACATLVAVYAPLQVRLDQSFASFFSCLAIHSLLRFVWGGRRIERNLNLILLPFTTVSTGLLGRELHRIDWPMAALPIGLLGAAAYVLLAGRDFSFVGQYVLAVLFTILGCFGANGIDPKALPHPWLGALLGSAALGYYVYDLAMVLKRRRMDEQLCAVSDLHCDLLNAITYPIRVFNHWRKFSI